MILANGQRVEATLRGETLFGHVHEDARGRMILLDDWLLVEPNDWAAVRTSKAPAITGGPGHRKWTRGDRVEFDEGGRASRGIVVSSDLVLAIVADEGGGNRRQVFCRGLRPSTVPAQAMRETVMRIWSVLSSRPIVGSSSAARDGFVAEIAHHGERVVTATNMGHRNSHIDGKASSVIMLRDMAAAWLRDAGVENLDPAVHGPVDLWIDYEVNQRPFGVDPHEHLRELDAEASGMQVTPRGP